MIGFYRQGFMYHSPADTDPATVRLRTEQALQAIRRASALHTGPPPRALGLSGQILDAGDTGGDGARIIDSGSVE